MNSVLWPLKTENPAGFWSTFDCFTSGQMLSPAVALLNQILTLKTTGPGATVLCVVGARLPFAVTLASNGLCVECTAGRKGARGARGASRAGWGGCE